MPKPDRTIADAHRDYAYGLEMARVGLELARLDGQPTTHHQNAIDSALEALSALEAIEAAPADRDEHVAGKVATWRSRWAKSQEVWEAIEANDPAAAFLHPRQVRLAAEGRVDPVANRLQAARMVDAIDAVADARDEPRGGGRRG